MSTPCLGLAHVAESQNFKEATVNTDLDGLDGAMNDLLLIDCTTGSSFTPTTASVLAAWLLKLTGSSGSAFTINLPSGKKKQWAVWNGAGHDATVQVTGAPGRGATVASGTKHLVYSDGVNCDVIV